MESGSDGAEAPSEATIADVKSFVKYVRSVVPLLLEGESEVPLELDTALKEALHVDYMKKFLSDAQIRTILVQRMPLKDEEEGEETSGADLEKQRSIYSVDIDVHYSAPKLSSVAFIKRGAVVEADKKVSAQLRVITLSEGSPFETLHAYISNSVAPFFKSFVRKSGKAERYGYKQQNNLTDRNKYRN